MPQARMQFNSDLRVLQLFNILSISAFLTLVKNKILLLRLHISKHCIINPCTSEFPACNVSIVCAYTHGRKSGKIYFKAVKVDTWCWQEPECPKAS